MKKRLLLFFLFLLPIIVSAEENSGSCGDNLTWTYTDGVLTISGNGDMYDYDGSNSPWKLPLYQNQVTTIKIGDGVTSIGNNAFNNFNNITAVTFPNSITRIGSGAFYSCNRLATVDIPNSVTHIGKGAFNDCDGLTKVNISDIEAWCKIIFESDNSNPLYYAHNLYINNEIATNISVPNNITEIRDYAFIRFTNLTSINFHNGVTSIGDHAFYECTNLTSINLPNSISYIGINAFLGCYRINTIYCLNPIPPTCGSSYTFNTPNAKEDNEVYNYAVLHVPMGSKEMYESFHGWRYFQKIKEDMEIDGIVYYANLTVQQGTTGYTRQSIKAGETYTIYIGTFADNRVNAVTFNGVDVTDEIVNGNYTTPEIKGESVLCISYEVQSSVPSLKLNNIRVTGYNGEITVSNIEEPSDICIYSTDGELVNRIPSAKGSAAISVSPEQLYIVKVGSRSYKIAL